MVISAVDVQLRQGAKENNQFQRRSLLSGSLQFALHIVHIL